MAVMTESEIESKLADLSGWELTGADGPPSIEKSFPQPNFISGLTFVMKVAVLAEKANHHPDVHLTYPTVTLSLMSHDVGGITERDFALAEQIEAI